MNRFFAVTDKGIEKVLAGDITKLAKGKIVSEDNSCVVFEAKDEAAFKFCYYIQSADRVALLLASFEFSDFDDFLEKAKNNLKDVELKGFFEESATYKVDCERRGEHDFNSSYLEQELGGVFTELVNGSLGFEPKVEFKRPDTNIYVFVNNNMAYIGVDLAGRNLDKRHYRIFTAPGVVNSKVYYSMVVLSGYTKKKKMVDLFSKAGVLAVEAALHANNISASQYNKDFAFKKIPKYKSNDWDGFFKKLDSEKKSDKLHITGYDPILRNLEAAKKNAKLAGADKIISFSKLDLEWADIKLDESTVDIALSRIPCPSEHHSENQIRKVYEELFHQAEFFLKEKGKLCVLSEKLGLLKEMLTDEFKVVEEHSLFGGKQGYDFLVLERNKK
jgi:23S rRNA G2445 N2-methylase RlmL